MGKYPTVENVDRKKAELRQIGISFEPLSNPALEPGLSLGGFATRGGRRAAAGSAVASAACAPPRWCRSGPNCAASCSSCRPSTTACGPRLDELQPVLGGKNLRPCR